MNENTEIVQNWKFSSKLSEDDEKWTGMFI